MSFAADKTGNTCYNPAAVGLSTDQFCCAANSCPCTSVTGKGIATKDPLTGKCPGGCDGACDVDAIVAAAKGIINDDMAKCLEPIDVRAPKCCSVSSGCVCTAVNTPQKGTDVARGVALSTGALLVVSILFEFGAQNAFLDKLGWADLPFFGDSYPIKGAVDLKSAMPSNMDAYSYVGSLTTPPCTEGVTAVIMRIPVPISPDQAMRFPYSHNYRPPQPLFGRKVYLNGQSPLGVKSTDGWSASAAALWGYDALDGPSTWGAEYPECKSGLEQSPVDIVPSKAVAGGVNVLRMYYKPTSGLKMRNTGHTFQVSFRALMPL
jgi:carbonic anhydrase